MPQSSFFSQVFGWWRAGDARARRAFIAASMGWMLDAYDVMLYAMVLAAVMADLRLTAPQAGLLGSVTLLAGAVGGLMFGVLADCRGRKFALVGSILLYSTCTGLCGLAQNVWQLALFRAVLGLGMGGQWASGAALVAETWPAEHRDKALGFMQSSWAIGYGAASIVTGFVQPRWGWRAVFLFGMVALLFVPWVQLRVEEPEIWARRSRSQSSTRFAAVFRRPLGRLTAAITLMNACTLFGWWGLNAWIPAYLSLPHARGGIGLSTYATAGLVTAMQVGMWFGYVSFGFIAGAVGRKRAYVAYLICASVLLPLYGFLSNPIALLALGPLVAFFGTGYFSGFGALTAEIYPTSIRASAQGFAYNTGRIASAAAPFVVGSLAASHGFAAAFGVAGSAFLLAATAWIWIPETRGAELS